MTDGDQFRVERADCLDWLAAQPSDSVDLVFGSPPYERARTYGIDFDLRGQDWVDWMVRVYIRAQRVCRGLVAFVVEGQTRDYRWSAAPALLMADLHRAGLCLRKPPVFHRVGIPGSGGPDWLRNDFEFVACTTRPGQLPWSENTACGHPPKWAPGGEMSYRLTSGERRNQWGSSPGKELGQRRRNGERQKATRPGHVVLTKTRTGPDEGEVQAYCPPVKANPGNVIRCNVGGGQMGSSLAHENEAPFPETLADFFVRSFCPPDGVVCDPFSGSGTTAAAALKTGRRFTGCDVRQSQVDLTLRRIQEVQNAVGQSE